MLNKVTLTTSDDQQNAPKMLFHNFPIPFIFSYKQIYTLCNNIHELLFLSIL